jgi:hypothetical protein
MSEYGSLLQRQMERIAPPSFTAEDLRRRRGRRQRNQRVASVALGLALLLLVLFVLGHGLGALRRREPLPASPPITPSDVAKLKLSWTGGLDAGPATSATVSGNAVYVGNGLNVRAYSATCGRGGTRCTPLWVGTAGSQIDNDVTEAGAVLYVGSDTLTAFPASCGSGQASCQPLWTTSPIGGGHAISAPAVSNGVVYVGSGTGKLYAFPTSCRMDGGICRPLWVGKTDTSRRLSTPAVSRGSVYVASDRLYAFPTRCAVRSCRASWSGPLRSQAFEPPVVAGGTVYVVADALYAFSTSCHANACGAGWTWRPPGGAAINGLTGSTNGVFVAADRLYALPLSCANTCKPMWASAAQTFSRPRSPTGWCS